MTTALRAPRALLALLALLATASSCAAPLQNGSITVRPGAETRLGVMCRYGGAAREVCASVEEDE
jgi:hypothetical protein